MWGKLKAAILTPAAASAAPPATTEPASTASTANSSSSASNPQEVSASASPAHVEGSPAESASSTSSTWKGKLQETAIMSQAAGLYNLAAEVAKDVVVAAEKLPATVVATSGAVGARVQQQQQAASKMQQSASTGAPLPRETLRIAVPQATIDAATSAVGLRDEAGLLLLDYQQRRFKALKDRRIALEKLKVGADNALVITLQKVRITASGLDVRPILSLLAPQRRSAFSNFLEATRTPEQTLITTKKAAVLITQSSMDLIARAKQQQSDTFATSTTATASSSTSSTEAAIDGERVAPARSEDTAAASSTTSSNDPVDTPQAPAQFVEVTLSVFLSTVRSASENISSLCAWASALDERLMAAEDEAAALMQAAKKAVAAAEADRSRFRRSEAVAAAEERAFELERLRLVAAVKAQEHEEAEAARKAAVRVEELRTEAARKQAEAARESRAAAEARRELDGVFQAQVARLAEQQAVMDRLRSTDAAAAAAAAAASADSVRSTTPAPNSLSGSATPSEPATTPQPHDRELDAFFAESADPFTSNQSSVTSTPQMRRSIDIKGDQEDPSGPSERDQASTPMSIPRAGASKSRVVDLPATPSSSTIGPNDDEKDDEDPSPRTVVRDPSTPRTTGFNLPYPVEVGGGAAPVAVLHGEAEDDVLEIQYTGVEVDEFEGDDVGDDWM